MYSQLILVVFLAILLLWVISSTEKSRVNEEQYSNSSNGNEVECSGSNDIKIGITTYDKMVDIVTNYSLMSSDYNKKLVLIYLSTFHLFDMNFSYESVKRLDDKLVKYPYIPNNIEYPSGNMHYSLQKAIITHITQQLDKSEMEFVNEFNADRKIIDIYLSTLFKSIQIM